MGAEMITGGRTQARDEVFTLIKTMTDTTAYDVIWQDDLEDKDVDDVLFIVAMQHVDGKQAGITQGLGFKKWESRGFITVQIRVPVKKGGLTLADNLTTIAENAFRGQATPNGVWFRDVVGREVPAKDGNSRTEVSAEFIYQETS